MDEFIKMLPSLGVGGILAGIIFYFYRQDRLDSHTRFNVLYSQFTDVAKSYQGVIQDNTKAITELVITLKNGNGNGNGHK